MSMRKVWKVFPGLHWNMLMVRKEKDSDSIIPIRHSLADAVIAVMARVIVAADAVIAVIVRVLVSAVVVGINKVL